MSTPYATLGAAEQTARETREVEGSLELVRRLNDVAAKAIARTNDMKARLLGLSEPQGAGPKDGPRPVACELTELRTLLNSLDGQLSHLHENITVLERV
jgi:hypothetical protein